MKKLIIASLFSITAYANPQPEPVPANCYEPVTKCICEKNEYYSNNYSLLIYVNGKGTFEKILDIAGDSPTSALKRCEVAAAIETACQP